VTLVYVPGWYAAQLGTAKLPGAWRLIQSRYPSTRNGGLRELYPGDNHEAWTTPVAGALPAIWQYASSARFPGYSGNVDVNAFRGSVEELASLRWFKDYGKASRKREPAPTLVVAEPLDSFKAVTWNPFNGTPRAPVEPILDAQLARGVSLVLGQEMQADFWEDLFKSRGLRVRKHDQYVVAWSPDYWTGIVGGAVRLSDQAWASKGADRERYSEAAWQILCDDKGRTIDALSYHGAPAVQRPEATRPERRFQATVESFAYLGQRAHESETAAVLYGGDDNIDEFVGVGAESGLWSPMLAAATGLRQIQAPDPTHGKKRRIDDFRIRKGGRLKPGDGWTFDGGADHRGHGRELSWRDV
jgi:hypothetical protein